MKSLFFVMVLICPLLSAAFGQDRAIKFENYPASTIFNGKNAKLKLGKDLYTSRTRIRYAGNQKRNFAGEYVLSAWGCGAECLSPVAVNVRTGVVYGAPFTVCCWSFDEGIKPIDFRLKSRLIVFSGRRNESDKDSRDDVHYYDFRNGKFRFIKTTKRTRNT